jgi:hypothetical protein
MPGCAKEQQRVLRFAAFVRISDGVSNTSQPLALTEHASSLIGFGHKACEKEDAAIDHWFKDLAPSAVLRQWFDHDVER